MTRPAVVPYRWTGHGLDVRAHVTETQQVLFFAADVCLALEVHVEWERDTVSGRIITRYPVPTLTVDGIESTTRLGPDEFRQPAELLEADQVRRLALNHTTEATAGFLLWFEELLAQLDTAMIEGALESNPPASEVLLMEGATLISVRRAAVILSRDPAIQLGQTALFEAMRLQEWIDRVEGWWRPAARPVSAGWLTTEGRRIPGRKALYPQILITASGIHELHRLLGGVADLTIDSPPALTLVETP